MVEKFGSESELSENTGSRGGLAWVLGGGVLFPKEIFLEFSSKNAGFYAFLLRKSYLRPDTGTGRGLIDQGLKM